MDFFKTKKGMAITAAAAVLTVVLIILAARGCDQEEETATGTTATGTSTATTATTEEEDVAAATIVSQSVAPVEATEGDTLTFTVIVQGDVASVSLTDQLPPATGAGQPRDNFTMEMSLASEDGDLSTWTLQATAAGIGRHPFFATAVTPDGTGVQAAGDVPTYLVSPASAAPQAQDTALEIIESTADPENLNDGEQISFTVRVKGGPDSVIMNYGPAGGSIGNNNVLYLSQSGSESGGITVWTGSMAADASKCFSMNNACYYTAEAVRTEGSQIVSVKVPNNGEWTYFVTP